MEFRGPVRGGDEATEAFPAMFGEGAFYWSGGHIVKLLGEAGDRGICEFIMWRRDNRFNGEGREREGGEEWAQRFRNEDCFEGRGGGVFADMISAGLTDHVSAGRTNRARASARRTTLVVAAVFGLLHAGGAQGIQCGNLHRRSILSL